MKLSGGFWSWCHNTATFRCVQFLSKLKPRVGISMLTTSNELYDGICIYSFNNVAESSGSAITLTSLAFIRSLPHLSCLIYPLLHSLAKLLTLNFSLLYFNCLIFKLTLPINPIIMIFKQPSKNFGCLAFSSSVIH